DQVFPILTPRALDPAHPFPFIPNQGSCVIFAVVRRSDHTPIRDLVLLPTAIPRSIRVGGKAARYVTTETLIARSSYLRFPAYDVQGAAACRLLRDSDIEIEEEAEDLVLTFRSAIKRRKRGRVIRLEMEDGIDPGLESVLLEELGGSEAILTETGGFLGIGDL